MQEASLGDASCKCIICIIYQDININDQLSLTPCKSRQQQNCSCSCTEVSFSHQRQQDLLPASPFFRLAQVLSSSLSAG